MKLRLLRNARINHMAGDVVDVSPSEGSFLLSVGSAEVVAEKATLPKVEVAEKAVKEPKATATRKTTRTSTKATKKG